MQGRVKTTINRLLVGMVLLAGLGMGLALVGDEPDLSPPGELTPAQTVAFRFAEEWDDITSSLPPTDASADAEDASEDSAADGDDARGLFDPRPTYQSATTEANATSVADAAAQDAVAAQAQPLDPPQTVIPAAAIVPGAPAPSAAAPVRRANPSAMLNDAQIASIKQRLNLNRDQERMWPSVEAALRRLSYRKLPKQYSPATTGSARLASIDLGSSEFDGLKSAAVPLIMTMNDDQKSELRMLVHIMGLERLAAQF